eukprot:UN28840
MREADILCDTIGIMSKGKIMVQGTPVDLKKRHGVGYEFETVIKNEDALQELENNLLTISPNIAVKGSEKEEHKYKVSIPAEETKLARQVIQLMENSRIDGRIDIFSTRLEDVFLRLAEEQARTGMRRASVASLEKHR